MQDRACCAVLCCAVTAEGRKGFWQTQSQEPKSKKWPKLNVVPSFRKKNNSKQTNNPKTLNRLRQEDCLVEASLDHIDSGSQQNEVRAGEMVQPMKYVLPKREALSSDPQHTRES